MLVVQAWLSQTWSSSKLLETSAFAALFKYGEVFLLLGATQIWAARALACHYLAITSMYQQLAKGSNNQSSCLCKTGFKALNMLPAQALGRAAVRRASEQPRGAQWHCKIGSGKSWSLLPLKNSWMTDAKKDVIISLCITPDTSWSGMLLRKPFR